MEKLLLLNTHLNDLYGNNPIVPNCRIDRLEREIFSIESLNLRELLEHIDRLFLVDGESQYDKILKKIDLIATSRSNFTLKFLIE